MCGSEVDGSRPIARWLYAPEIIRASPYLYQVEQAEFGPWLPSQAQNDDLAVKVAT